LFYSPAQKRRYLEKNEREFMRLRIKGSN